MNIDVFGSRRKGRRHLDKIWPAHVMIKLSQPLDEKVIDNDLSKWVDSKQVYHDSTQRRWWFKEPSVAVEFKLRFGGKK